MKGVRDFFLHLRLNYNFLILSAPFFLGALYLPRIENIKSFIFLYLLMYVFLFGGVNAYNSYFDKDEGPIGGLEHPPKMKRWMLYVSICFQIIALVLAMLVGYIYSIFMLLAMGLSWLYSNPKMRFKAKPALSFLVIGVGTVFIPALFGYFIAGGSNISVDFLAGIFGTTFIVLSMYPFSQAYQIEEDKKKGDITFAVKYGTQGVKNNSLILFPLGILFLTYSFLSSTTLVVAALIIGIPAYILLWQVVKSISGNRVEYKRVMMAKYYGGATFTLAILILATLF
ncbi:MAG: UbiA family prenyltransferase [bacterium]